MVVFTEILPAHPTTTSLGVVYLDHSERRRGRLRSVLDDGTPIGLALPQGTVLYDGTVLSTQLGAWCIARAKTEPVSVATTTDAHRLARAAYHLGNRHVAVELVLGSLVYLYDSFIDRLCTELGLAVTRDSRIFEPEKFNQRAHAHAHRTSSSVANDSMTPDARDAKGA